ncbi:MAG TPA: BON domain-containing protein [Rhodocyclaceae bacterium]|nr:BON domain-containing protein [Rhodocyclaceae bacterium]
MTKEISLPLKLLTVAAVTFALAACSKDDDTTAGQKLDSVVASAEQHANDAKSEVVQGMAAAKEGAKEAAADIADKAGDAAITAGVHAELAKDAGLSTLSIDVDTNGGKVSLHGTAPDAEARARAARLAGSVKGVIDVDNQLEVAK